MSRWKVLRQKWKYGELDIKKYNILEMSIIFSLNININDYNQLIAYKEFINKIFLQKVKLYNKNYNLLGFNTQSSFNLYIGYFKIILIYIPLV